MTRKKDPELWLINLMHDRDISLADLRITVRKGARINLLDKKHYHFTDDQIRNSILSGSIHKKSNMLAVREVIHVSPPPITIKEVEKNRRVLKPIRHKKHTDVQAPAYAELDIDETMSDEQYAAEMADFEQQDHAPNTLAVDEKFKE